MRIGIDARFYGSDSKGLGRYTQQLIAGLEKKYGQSNGDCHFFIFLKKKNFNEYRPKNKNFHKVLADYKWYGFAEQIKMPLLLNKYKLDLVHFPHFNVPVFYRRPFVVTIHDLILLHFPTVRNTTLNPLVYRLKFLAYKIIIGKAVRKSKKIITVSNFTKSDILANYGIPADKIAVTYEAGNKSLKNKLSSEQGDEVLKKYGIIKPYLLYVGNAYPHKNLENFVKAWNSFVAQNETKEIRLVLVGKDDYFYNRLRRMVAKNKIRKVIFAGYVPDEELGLIYQNSLAYVFPSLYEGFGLPPLEAMGNDVPVVSSDHKCMREILGKAALFFDAKSEKDTISVLQKIVEDEKLRNDLKNAGKKCFAKYDWLKMSEQTMDIYKKVLETK